MAEKRWFADDDHALVTGYVMGTLAKAGIEFNMVRDALGNYKPFMELVIPDPLELEPIRVTIQVMPGANRGAQNDTDEPALE
jgi:hypothetical protein